MQQAKEHRVAIIGDGQMGLVLTDALAQAGVGSIRLWGPFPDDIAALQAERVSHKRLPGFAVPDPVELVHDDAAAIGDATCIINAIPTQFVRRVWERLKSCVPTGVPIACVSKGVETGTHFRPSQILADVLGESETDRPLCALSGPTVAAELARRLPATLVAASPDPHLPTTMQILLDVHWLRTYTHDDLVGVELAGATKNVIALAAGMIDGLEVGANAKSALLARGLAEMARLGKAMGSRVDTFFGVAGVGDLATTCFSPSSRNRTCGERIGRGESLEQILNTTVSVVEGVPTTQSVCELAAQHGVDMPITQAVKGILFDGLKPREAIDQLMHRAPRAEKIG